MIVVKKWSSDLIRLVREAAPKVVFARFSVAGWLRIRVTARVTRLPAQQEEAVALHVQQTQDVAWRFELRPNRSRSWAQTKCFWP